MALTKISRSLLDTGISDSSDATAITINSSEQVGIGVSPSATLQLKAASGNTGLYLQDASGSPNISWLDAGGTVQWQIYSTMGGANGLDPLVIYSSAGEVARIDSSGNVGVGTTDTNSHKMAIDSGSGTSLGLMHKSSNTFTLMTFKASGSTQDIRLGATGNDMIFQTNGTERMRIDSSGGVMFNTTTALGQTTSLAGTNTNNFTGKTTTDTYSNFLGFASGGNITYYVTGQGNYFYNGSAVSDRDLKENIESITESSLAKVKLLEPKTFNFKADDNFGTNKKTGFIAQEVAAIFGTTDGVATGTDGQKDMGIDPTGLIAHLTKAIQEQQEQIEALQSEVNTLKGE